MIQTVFAACATHCFPMKSNFSYPLSALWSCVAGVNPYSAFKESYSSASLVHPPAPR